MRHPESALTGQIQPADSRCESPARWLSGALYIIAAVAFVSDICRDNLLAYGMIYAPLVATALFHKSRSGLWILTAATCCMVIAGAFLPAVASDLPDLIGNRVLSILAIVATAFFVHHARVTQERLAAETRRAEAAEQMKSDVLTNLSQEIRTPLHTLLGVLTLTMAASKPDQREALGRIRADGKELLAIIDNLIDLTQIEDRKLRRQPIDMVTIAADAAESARIAADERQISISMGTDRDAAKPGAAVGDSWAMRRILDNLLANAVRFTPPGGMVSVSVARSAGTVTASVSDTGRGLPPEMTRDCGDGELNADTSGVRGGTGLALSNRLARAMNGKLTAHNRPHAGAIVTLSLPAT
jgi:signal transduction histidine kinase